MNKNDFSAYSRQKKNGAPLTIRQRRFRFRKNNINNHRQQLVSFLIPLVVMLCLLISSSWTTEYHPVSTTSSSSWHFFVLAADQPPATNSSSTENAQRRQQQQEGGGGRRKEEDLVTKDDEKLLSAKRLTLNQILIRAGKRGLGGGIPGALAGVIQVLSLMWLRTITNYQCRYGTAFRQSLITLLNEGGIARLYRGLGFALIQAPISRFVSTAANDGVESLLAGLELTKLWGPGRTTVVASIIVGIARMMLMPIDTAKTVLQVDSAEGFRNLVRRVKAGKITVLYEGAIASAFAAIIGHYPWFFTYSTLQASAWVHKMLPSKLLANAAIGFFASMVSDIVTNAARVIKTTKQALASKHNVGYTEIIRMVIAADGYKGLFGRGLRTRIMANALQSVMFTVLWRGIAERWQQRTGVGNDSSKIQATEKE